MFVIRTTTNPLPHSSPSARSFQMAALGGAAVRRVHSIVRFPLHAFPRRHGTDPTFFTDVSVRFNFGQWGNRTLEEHLLNHGIALDKADETHANPIFAVKTHEQASNSKLFAVYRVRAWLYLPRSPICDLSLFVREKIANKPVSTYSQIVATNMLYSTSTTGCSSCAFIYRISSRGSMPLPRRAIFSALYAAFVFIPLPPGSYPPPPTIYNP
jgi:hypothetical protein